MMDPLVVVAKIQKIIKDRLQAVGDTMITGGVDSMEKYQYMLDIASASAISASYLARSASNIALFI